MTIGIQKYWDFMKPTSQDFTQMPIKDFAKKIICDGHLYLRTKEGRRFYLMKPGILIDQSFIKKHATHQTVFEYVPVVDEVKLSQFQTLFKELKYLQFEKDLRLKTADVISFFKGVYELDGHFLNFALACFLEFNAIPEEYLIKMHEADLHLFRKSLYSAAFAVIIGFANDFYHYPMIKDFYNLTLGLDLGLCESNYSYFVAEACNKENQKPGSGKDWMQSEGASDLELEVFLSHPKKSHEFFKKQKGLLAYPELVEITLYQHELSNGKGFPRGIPKSQVSGWEAVVILASSMVEIRDEYDFECDVLNFIVSFKNQKLTEIPVQRVYQKLSMAFDGAFSAKEIAG
jgi:hypothetical protein